MTLSEREKAFKEAVFSQVFDPEILQEFYEYWTEPNKSQSKLRFELERTWDLKRRLNRWQRIRDSRPDFTKKEVAKVQQRFTKPPETDMERLEVFYMVYCTKPTAVDFKLFGQWFSEMKDRAMLKELNEDEKKTLRDVYGANGEKLRCAWVQVTFDHWAKINYQFKKSNLLKAV